MKYIFLSTIDHIATILDFKECQIGQITIKKPKVIDIFHIYKCEL